MSWIHDLSDAQLATEVAQRRVDKKRETTAAKYDPSGGCALLAAACAADDAMKWRGNAVLTALLDEQKLRARTPGGFKALQEQRAVAAHSKAEREERQKAAEKARQETAEKAAKEKEAADAAYWEMVRNPPKSAVDSAW